MKRVSLQEDINSLISKYRDPQQVILNVEEQDSNSYFICNMISNSLTDLEKSQLIYNITESLKQKVIPKMQELMQLGNLLELNIFRIIALLLKCDWEGFIDNNCRKHEEGSPSEMIMEKVGNMYSPESSFLYDSIRTHCQFPALSNMGKSEFKSLVQEMILSNLHILGNCSPELRGFVQRKHKEYELSINVTDNLKRTFSSEKSTWIQLQEEFGDILLVLERRRLENANLTRKWMKLFGKDYVDLYKDSYEYREIQLKVELLELDPDLTREELEKLVADTVREMATDLFLMQIEQLFSQNSIEFDKNDGFVLSPEEMTQFRKKSKHVLKKIWLLIHPDRLHQHPDYDNFTDKQKKQLKNLWHEMMKIKEEEKSSTPGFVGYEYRSLTILLDIFETIKAIFSAAGIDTDVNLIIQGETLEEQIFWLKKANNSLERDIEKAKVEIKVLLEDEENRQKAALIASPMELQEKARKNMRERTKYYREEADRLKHRLNELFNVRETS